MVVPDISTSDLIAYAKEVFPDACVVHTPMNPQYKSWRIEIRSEGRWLEFAWGPLSGFGASDILHQKFDVDPFGPYEVALDSFDAAKSWLRSKREEA